MDRSTKSCRKCHREKALGEFPLRKNSSDGRRNECKLCTNALMKKWVNSNKSRRKEIYLMNDRQLRINALVHYGGNPPQCKCCGEQSIEFLCIDHVDGGGNKHRETENISGKIARWLKKNNYPEGFRILCSNCNSSLGFWGYCPHNKKKTEDRPLLSLLNQIKGV